MNSFEANKIFGALLGTVFVLFGGSLLAEGIFHAEAPEQPGFAIAVPDAPAGGGGAAPAANEVTPVGQLMQTANAEAGAAIFKRCQACHSGEKGGPTRSARSVGRRQPSDRLARGLQLLGRHYRVLAGQDGGLGLGSPEPLPAWAQAVHQGHGDGLRRHPEGSGARRPPRLSRHAVGQPAAPPAPDAGAPAGGEAAAAPAETQPNATTNANALPNDAVTQPQGAGTTDQTTGGAPTAPASGTVPATGTNAENRPAGAPVPPTEPGQAAPSQPGTQARRRTRRPRRLPPRHRLRPRRLRLPQRRQPRPRPRGAPPATPAPAENAAPAPAPAQ